MPDDAFSFLHMYVRIIDQFAVVGSEWTVCLQGWWWWFIINKRIIHV